MADLDFITEIRTTPQQKRRFSSCIQLTVGNTTYVLGLFFAGKAVNLYYFSVVFRKTEQYQQFTYTFPAISTN